MTTLLDIDDVCAGNPEAARQLAVMREAFAEMEAKVAALTQERSTEYGIALQRIIELEAELDEERRRFDNAMRNEMIETKEYTDGTTATGVSPLPDRSPVQQATEEALRHLDDIEAVMGGRNGSSIQLRSLILSIGA